LYQTIFKKEKSVKNIHRHILWALTVGWIFLFLSCGSPEDGPSGSGNTTTPGDTTAPGGITAMGTTLGEGGQITFTWTDPADADFDHIEITFIPTGSVLQPIIVTKETQTTTVTGLTEGTSYTFTFQAVDKTGNKNAGQTITLSPNSTPPGEVTGLSGSLLAGGKVQLTWTDPADADLKHIEITWTAGDGGSETVVKGLRTWTKSGLTEGTAYTFTVKAVDTVGNKSTGQNTGPLTPDATPPADVTSLDGTPGNAEVTLTWMDPADGDLDHIEITFSPAVGSITQPISIANGTQTTTISGLTNKTAYTFTVNTVYTLGNKNAGVTTASITPLAPTGLVKVEFDGLPEDTTINLSDIDDPISWAANTTLSINVASGGFSAFRWELDGEALPSETNDTLVLYTGGLSVKQHSITVFVTKSGVEYSKRVTFAVQP
jgi:titin